ncbi:MAG: hypothetical protein V3575_03750 [Candidatus Absconditabacteria bacterium]
MSFLLSFVSTIIGSVSTILWKKAINMSTISAVGFIFLGNISSLLFALVLYFGTNMKSIFDLNLLIFIVIALGIIIQLIYSPIYQQLYKENKISEMIPFSNLNKIFTIIIAFIFFQQGNIKSFIIGIITLIVIIAFSIDFENFKLPKKLHYLIFVEVGISIKIILVGYALLKINALELFVYTNFISVVMNGALVMKGTLKKDLEGMNLKLFYYRSLPALLGGINVLIGNYLIQSLGLFFSNLLSFMGIAFTIILSFIFFGDKPSKKNIIQSFIVAILVGIGFYFK